MTEPLSAGLTTVLVTELAVVGPVAIVLALLAGGVIGAGFFGGLWWTTRRAAAAAQPALWVMASLLLRMGGALTGFHLVGAGQWPRLLACLLGFVLARLLVLRLTRPAQASAADGLQLAQEGRHAPEPR